MCVYYYSTNFIFSRTFFSVPKPKAFSTPTLPSKNVDSNKRNFQNNISSSTSSSSSSASALSRSSVGKPPVPPQPHLNATEYSNTHKSSTAPSSKRTNDDGELGGDKIMSLRPLGKVLEEEEEEEEIVEEEGEEEEDVEGSSDSEDSEDDDDDDDDDCDIKPVW